MEYRIDNGLVVSEEPETDSNEFKRMDKYRVSDEQWKLIEERLNGGSTNAERSCSQSSNSKLSKYRISGEQLDHLEKRMKSNGIDPSQSSTPLRQDKSASLKQHNKYELLARHDSTDSGYAKLDHIRNELHPQDIPDYEKVKKSPHPNRKESSLQQKIQHRKELSQSIQSLSSEAIQDLKSLTIPKDGDLQGFSVEEMSTFFRYLRIEDNIVQRLSKKNVDGIKFSKLKDIDLENIGIKNPIVMHFRDRSCKKKIPFML
ncbi:uncharacterized protein [Mytilus edulis]|uniref:uncharacterized protein n=1 Tax=Mytilus edulis TaxID=6550 RepID=UPI0039EF8161